jgi:hypothetical protein
LEYGESLVDEDPFNIQRTHRHDSDHAHQSRFLHPIIRRFDGDQLLSEHHIIEDLYGIWLENCHINPTRGFFQKELSCIEDNNIIMVI